MEENRVKYAVERFKEELSVLNKTIWEAAEIKYEEYRSEAAVIEVLRKHGFRLEEQVADIPTAFRAVYGSGRPVIGLLAEYRCSGRAQSAGGLPGEETASGDRDTDMDADTIFSARQLWPPRWILKITWRNIQGEAQ